MLFRIGFLVLFSLSNGYCCCQAFQKRLFPLGQSKGSMLLLKVELSRFCTTLDPAHIDLSWKGTATVIRVEQATSSVSEVLDSINFIECDCNLDSLPAQSKYREKLLPVYEAAVKACRRFPDFAPIDSVVMADTIDGKLDDEDRIRIDMSIGSGVSKQSKVPRSRVLWIKNRRYTIVTYAEGEWGSIERLNQVLRYKKDLYCESPQWHGEIRDVLYSN